MLSITSQTLCSLYRVWQHLPAVAIQFFCFRNNICMSEISSRCPPHVVLMLTECTQNVLLMCSGCHGCLTFQMSFRSHKDILDFFLNVVDVLYFANISGVCSVMYSTLPCVSQGKSPRHKVKHDWSSDTTHIENKHFW